MCFAHGLEIFSFQLVASCVPVLPLNIHGGQLHDMRLGFILQRRRN